jgi:hypothetical protein
MKKLIPAPLLPVARLSYRSSLRLAHWLRSRVAQPHPNPVFVLGNQKSGTTAIAALLGKHTGAPAALDLEVSNRNFDYPQVRSGERPLEWLIHRNALEFSRPIVKEPNLTFLYPQLREQYPSARFVFVVRDPRHNIRSILDRLQIPGTIDRRLLPLNDIAWENVVHGQWLGYEESDPISSLARRWNLASNVYLSNSSRMTLVRYEDFLKDKAGSIRELAETLGLPGGGDLRKHLEAPFQPPGKHRHTSLQDFFGEKNLRKITTLCAAPMMELGYTEPVE